MRKAVSEHIRALELRMFIDEVNYKRLKEGKRKLPAKEIARYLIKGKQDVLMNELIKI